MVGRWGSGLPFSRTTPAGDSLIGPPNSQRLPGQWGIDLRVTKGIHLGRLRLGAYVDVRNVTNNQVVVAVRRESGSPAAGQLQIDAAAEDAYAAHPEPIPYESPAYRPDADLDGNGRLDGRAELFPLYQRAAQDALQPLFAYGPLRLVRMGLQLEF